MQIMKVYTTLDAFEKLYVWLVEINFSQLRRNLGVVLLSRSEYRSR